MAGFTKEYEEELVSKQILAHAIRMVGRALVKRIDEGDLTTLNQVRKLCYDVSKGRNDLH